MPDRWAPPRLPETPPGDLPDDMSESQAYGLWDGLDAYDAQGHFRCTVPAHPGNIFPGGPPDYVEALRRALLSGRPLDGGFWPVRADIDITQKCTNRCYFCYARLYADDPRYRDAEMSPATFAAIIGDLAAGGTRIARFTGGGEPLLHPQFREMAPIPRRYGLRSCVITNGTCLDDDLDRLLIENLDHIRVSINAGTDSTWARIHRPRQQANRLGEILAHVKKMAGLRESLFSGAERPLIWLTYLVLPENAQEIYQAACAAKDCGADSISFRSVYHNLAHRWTDASYQIAAEQLARAGTLHEPPTFQVFTPKTALERVWQRQPQGAFDRCFKCQLTTFIEATMEGAQVKLCDVHRGMSGDERDVPGLSLGTITASKTFGDVWNSPEARALVANRPTACGKHCIAFGFNQPLNEVWQLLVEDPQTVFLRRRGRPVGCHPLPPRR